MICNFMPFPGSPRDDLGMFRDVFADHEERCLDVMRGQQIKQLGGERCAWPIIKRHGDVRAIDVHGIKRNARIFRRGLGFFPCIARRRQGVSSCSNNDD